MSIVGDSTQRDISRTLVIEDTFDDNAFGLALAEDPAITNCIVEVFSVLVGRALHLSSQPLP